MDELQIKGKKYISSKRASELTGYAKDYVGQLARGGKIAATRVGRAWYVDQDALLLHANTPESKVEGITPSDPSLAAETLEGKLRSKTFSTVSHALLSARKNLPSTWSSVEYSVEENPLFPFLPIIEPEVAPQAQNQNKEISDKRDSASVRITVLEKSIKNPSSFVTFDGISSISNVPTTKVVEEKNKNEKRQKITTSKFTYIPRVSRARSVLHPVAILASAAFIFAVCASGLFVSSHVSITGQGGAYSASAFVGYEYWRDIAKDSPLLQTGVAELKGFLSFVFGSFGELFMGGFNFLKELFHLV